MKRVKQLCKLVKLRILDRIENRMIEMISITFSHNRLRIINIELFCEELNFKILAWTQFRL